MSTLTATKTCIYHNFSRRLGRHLPALLTIPRGDGQSSLHAHTRPSSHDSRVQHSWRVNYGCVPSDFHSSFAPDLSNPRYPRMSNVFDPLFLPPTYSLAPHGIFQRLIQSSPNSSPPPIHLHSLSSDPSFRSDLQLWRQPSPHPTTCTPCGKVRGGMTTPSPLCNTHPHPSLPTSTVYLMDLRPPPLPPSSPAPPQAIQSIVADEALGRAALLVDESAALGDCAGGAGLRPDCCPVKTPRRTPGVAIFSCWDFRFLGTKMCLVLFHKAMVDTNNSKSYLVFGFIVCLVVMLKPFYRSCNFDNRIAIDKIVISKYRSNHQTPRGNQQASSLHRPAAVWFLHTQGHEDAARSVLPPPPPSHIE